MLTLFAATHLGCASMWQQIRERERLYAVESARAYAGQGKCELALNSLDRAQAKLDLGPFARESTNIRARCYENLGRTELAQAHRRLLADFYENDAIVARDPSGLEVLRVSNVALEGYGPPPSSLKIKPPRYNSHARRSGLVGRVVVAFDLSRDGKPTGIRVLEMPHTLLATWAIEAVLESHLRKQAIQSVAVDAHYLTILSFEWRWARTPEIEPDSQ
jgi:tetratricopeptide (TPR) repeat protein